MANSKHKFLTKNGQKAKLPHSCGYLSSNDRNDTEHHHNHRRAHYILRFHRRPKQQSGQHSEDTNQQLVQQIWIPPNNPFQRRKGESQPTGTKDKQHGTSNDTNLQELADYFLHINQTKMEANPAASTRRRICQCLQLFPQFPESRTW
jgi:hypothetical protein